MTIMREPDQSSCVTIRELVALSTTTLCQAPKDLHGAILCSNIKALLGIDPSNDLDERHLGALIAQACHESTEALENGTLSMHAACSTFELLKRAADSSRNCQNGIIESVDGQKVTGKRLWDGERPFLEVNLAGHQSALLDLTSGQLHCFKDEQLQEVRVTKGSVAYAVTATLSGKFSIHDLKQGKRVGEHLLESSRPVSLSIGPRGEAFALISECWLSPDKAHRYAVIDLTTEKPVLHRGAPVRCVGRPVYSGDGRVFVKAPFPSDGPRVFELLDISEDPKVVGHPYAEVKLVSSQNGTVYVATRDCESTYYTIRCMDTDEVLFGPDRKIAKIASSFSGPNEAALLQVGVENPQSSMNDCRLLDLTSREIHKKYIGSDELLFDRYGHAYCTHIDRSPAGTRVRRITELSTGSWFDLSGCEIEGVKGLHCTQGGGRYVINRGSHLLHPGNAVVELTTGTSPLPKGIKNIYEPLLLSDNEEMVIPFITRDAVFGLYNLDRGESVLYPEIGKRMHRSTPQPFCDRAGRLVVPLRTELGAAELFYPESGERRVLEGLRLVKWEMRVPSETEKVTNTVYSITHGDGESGSLYL